MEKMRKINISDLVGEHIFDGSEDYRIESYSYPNIYVRELEYDIDKDEFIDTDIVFPLLTEEVERGYREDRGKNIKIIW